ncbi:Hypothetical predicted protein [Mytilus galloprovincialis]|uniref:Uncharacterized protein n=1 Tax=Mytilus galloprovincialis TaxID=29158 RepID=A0A8B6C587_MYTGA|nr:Hypothetical predicted protein [Mytilus galloprovincialis]
MATLAFQQQCIKINSCSYEELRLLPGVGNVIADKIMSMRETLGNIQPEHLMEIPRLKITEALIDLIDFSPHQTQQLEWQQGPNENIEKRDYSRNHNPNQQTSQLGWQQGPNENIEKRDYSRNHNPHQQTSQVGRQQGPNEHKPRTERPVPVPRRHQRIPSPEIQHRIRIPSPEIRRRIPLPEIQRRIPSPEIFREPVYSLRTPNPAYSSTMNRNMYTPRPFLSYHESPQLMPPAKPKSKNLEIPKGLKYDGSSSWKTFYTKF